MGGPKIALEFEEQLNKDIDESYVNYIKINDSKNIFNAARTPAVFLVILIVAYLLSGIFMMVGLESLASLFNLAIGLALLSIMTWAYVRFSGELREIGTQLDTVAEWVWDEVRLFFIILGTQKLKKNKVSRFPLENLYIEILSIASLVVKKIIITLTKKQHI